MEWTVIRIKKEKKIILETLALEKKISVSELLNKILDDYMMLHKEKNVLHEDVTSCNMDVTSCNMDVTSCNTDVTSCNTDVTSLEDRLINLETRFDLFLKTWHDERNRLEDERIQNMNTKTSVFGFEKIPPKKRHTPLLIKG